MKLCERLKNLGAVAFWQLGCCFVALWGVALDGAAQVPLDGSLDIPWGHYSTAPSNDPAAIEVLEDGLVLKGNGQDIWTVADSFDYAFVPWSGDGVFVCRIVALNAKHEWAKAGIMIRDALTPDSSHAFVSVTPNKGVNFIRRVASGLESLDDNHHQLRRVVFGEDSTFVQRSPLGPKTASGAITEAEPQRWIKLVRRGETIQAYDSIDGVDWSWLGTDRIDLGTDVFVGLALSSHDSEEFASVQMDSWSASAAPVSFADEPLVIDSAAFQGKGTGTGLRGEYFPSPAFEGEPLVRIDPQIDLNWNEAAPWPEFPKNHFGVRWQGQLEADLSGIHFIHLQSDDRARLWLDGALVIDEWQEHSNSESSALVSFEAGRRYTLRIDYFENRGDASIRLLWSHPSRPKQLIPSDRLYAEVPDDDGDLLPDRWEERVGLSSSDPTDGAGIVREHELSYAELFRVGENPGVLAGPAFSEDHPSGVLASDSVESAWRQSDLGPAGHPGSSLFDETFERLEIASHGVAIGGIRDGVHFVSQRIVGDFVFTAKVASLQSSSSAALAGLMIRESLLSEGPSLFWGRNNSEQFELHCREQFAVPAMSWSEGGSGAWLRIERLGTVLRAWESNDGDDWRWFASHELGQQEEVHVGLAIASQSGDELAEAFITDIDLDLKKKPKKPKKADSGRGNGLAATYFFGEEQRQRVDAQIDFDWDTGAPLVDFPSDEFGVRWEGILEVPETDEYLMGIVSDDGARLWIDDVLVLDDWADSGRETDRVRLDLQKDRLYRVRVEYYERFGEAIVHWFWASLEIPWSIVPKSQLYSDAERMREAYQESWASRIPEERFFDRQSVIGDGEVEAHPANKAFKRKEGLRRSELSLELSSELKLVDGLAHRGDWEALEGQLVCQSRNGSVSLEFSVEEPGLYYAEVSGGEAVPHRDKLYDIDLRLDEVDIGSVFLLAGDRESAGFYTPFLSEGEHALDLSWRNAQDRRSLRLDQVKLFRLIGKGKDRKALDKWVQEELSLANSLESSEKKVRTSPFPIEGRSRYVPWVALESEGVRYDVYPAAGHRWWANIDLLERGKTEVVARFENGGLEERHEFEWEVTSMAKDDAITVRVGDSLLIAVDSKAKKKAAESLAEIEGPSWVRNRVQVGEVFKQAFLEAGDWELKASYRDDKGKSVEESLLVRVLAPLDVPAFAVWVSHSRVASFPGLESGLELEAGRSLQFKKLPGRSHSFSMTMKAPADEWLTIRTEPEGLILQSIPVHGFEFATGLETGGIKSLKTFDDGTRLLEAMLVSEPRVGSVNMDLRIATAGVLFEGGGTRQVVGTSDFNDLGEFPVRFLQSPTSPTGVCHRIWVQDREVVLGEYR